MDIQSVNSALYNKVENQCHYLKDLFNLENGSSAGVRKQDALEAVKLDPAVLEAQVTVHSAAKEDVKRPESRGITDVKTGAVSVAMATPERDTPSSQFKGFSDMILQHEAALLSLSPQHLEMLMDYVDVLRRQRMNNHRQLECAFCKNNGKPVLWYASHALKDARGRVRCPVLRGFRCPRCGATGDRAHTIKYCPDLLIGSSCENLLL